jgi:N6-adenosine-specific RNA methylase IME4
MKRFDPFDGLNMFGYDVIVADNPWLFQNYSEKGEEKNATSHYECVPLEEIKKLPVGHLAAENCVLFMWVTNPVLRQGFEVLDAWGFREAGFITWNKTTVNDVDVFGTGYNLRCSTEHMILGFLGSPKHHKSQRTGFRAPVTKIHSQKPEASFQIAEKYLIAPKNQKRVELFSRKSRKGWDTAGKEAGKYGGTAGPDDKVLVRDFFPHLSESQTPQLNENQKEMFLQSA